MEPISKRPIGYRQLGALGCAGIVVSAVLLVLFKALFEADFDRGPPPDRIRTVHTGSDQRTATAPFIGPAENALIAQFDGDGTVVDLADPATTYERCLASFKGGVWATALQILSGGQLCSAFGTDGERPAAEELRAAPVLIVTGPDNPYGAFYAEIMKAEGLTLFNTMPSASVDEDALTGHSVILLGTAVYPSEHLPALRRWIEAGGTLVAMKPRGELARMLCLGEAWPPRNAAGYLRVGTSQATANITARPMQIHGETARYQDLPDCLAELNPANGVKASEVIASLHDGNRAPLPHPAITTRRIGKGKAIIFAFDLARSVVLTRQGNPVWANQEHDGSPPRRPSDLFQHGYLDTALLDVPQADEQQRLLANLILTSASMPLPRFWYLPERRRAAIIMVGDDHATDGGTEGLFSRLARSSPENCDLQRWQCLRATALLSPGTVFSPEAAELYHDVGFEIGLHVDTGCTDRRLPALRKIYAAQTSEFRSKYPSLPPQVSQRLHCIVWNGWTDTVQLESSFGVRFDMNYYNWPPHWLKARPGFMTGSSLPMPFITRDGVLLDVYQAPTQLVNEDGVPHREGVAKMLDAALGDTQYFSTFAAHYDFADGYDEVLIEEAGRRGVALISARQMLHWLDGRNGSSFSELQWSDGRLDFRIDLARGAEHASVLLPLSSGADTLTGIRCEGNEMPFVTEEIKGLEYAFFSALDGACSSTYRADAG